MNEVVVRRAIATFHIESFSTPESLKLMAAECLKIYATAWSKGYAGMSGHVFDPDVDLFVGMLANGTRRFITARIDGDVVASQHWIVVNDPDSRRRRMAHMTQIYKRSPEVCDTVEFLRFGIAAMRAAGATNVLLSCFAEVRGFKEKMEAAGCRMVEYVMEA